MVVDRYGAVRSRRFYRPESLWNLRLSARCGGLVNPGARALMRSTAVLDVSAGDSFTDLYGEDRFRAVIAPKLIALQSNRPLILLPQTYGPFKSEAAKSLAVQVLRRASLVWARDEDSYGHVKELLGDEFDASRHRCGVDLAFLLPSSKPDKLPATVDQWLSPHGDPQSEVVGFNISGLVYNRPDLAANQFQLQASYRPVVEEFLKWLLRKTNVRILLLPHVLTRRGRPESDIAAAEAVQRKFREKWPERISVVPADYSASELKWIIGCTSWFCGTRMHATIAALSSGVPAVALSYSLKTAGVFASCGLRENALEMRSLSTETLLAQLKAAWKRRQTTAQRLHTQLPHVLQQANSQMDEIVEFVNLRRNTRQVVSSRAGIGDYARTRIGTRDDVVLRPVETD